MVGLQGISGVPEPSGPRPAHGRTRAAEPAPTASGDGVEISDDALHAASASSRFRLSGTAAEIRAERIEEARQNLEDGLYKMHDVVRQVASRLSKYVY